LGLVATVMPVRTVHPGALVCILASDLRVNEQALVAVSALREELALVLWMHILTHPVWLVALGPVFAAHLDFVSARFLVLALVRNAWYVVCWLGRFHRAKSLQTFFLQFFSLFRGKFLLEKWLTHRVMGLLLMHVIVRRVLLPHVTTVFTEHHLVLVKSVVTHVRQVSLLARPTKGTLVVTHG